VAEAAKASPASVVAAGVQRSRTGLTDAGHAARRALGRFRGRERHDAAATPASGSTPQADDTMSSPMDLADADVSVQRAWRSVRLAIAIIVTVAPVVAALISWRIRVARAQRRGQLIDP
jgi:hypothetical protein